MHDFNKIFCESTLTTCESTRTTRESTWTTHESTWMTNNKKNQFKKKILMNGLINGLPKMTQNDFKMIYKLKLNDTKNNNIFLKNLKKNKLKN